MSPLLASLLLAVPVQAEPVTLLIQTPNSPKLPSTTKEEALGMLRQAVEATFQKRLEENGYRPTFLAATDGYDRPIRKEEAQRLVADGYPRVAILRIERWDQRNLSHSQMLDNPNRPKSETKVHLKFWFTADGAVDPERKLDGFAGGPYFGTTDRWETSGSPDAKAYNIRLANRQRLDAIAAATWDAIKAQYPKH
ncbi:MAG: hypothetical protein ACO1SV_21910 [Fimbriimonas sp.]